MTPAEPTNTFQVITLGNLLACGTFIVSIILAVWNIRGKITGEIKACEEKFEKSIAEIRTQEDIKRKDMYRRIDELKAAADAKFMSKEISSLLHEGTAKSIAELQGKFEGMKAEVKNDIAGVAKTLTETRDKMIAIAAKSGKD